LESRASAHAPPRTPSHVQGQDSTLMGRGTTVHSSTRKAPGNASYADLLTTAFQRIPSFGTEGIVMASKAGAHNKSITSNAGSAASELTPAATLSSPDSPRLHMVSMLTYQLTQVDMCLRQNNDLPVFVAPVSFGVSGLEVKLSPISFS